MRRPAAMMAASGIKGGDKVIELAPGGGYVTRLLSKIVGPTGKVYAANLPTFNEKMKGGPINVTSNPAYGNVTIIEMPYSELKAPEPVDVVWTSENYHDFKNMGQFRTDTNAMNRAVFAALKPGGRYIVTDFTAQPGAGLTQDARRCTGSSRTSSAWKCWRRDSCWKARATRSRIRRIRRRPVRTRTRIRSISSSANRDNAGRYSSDEKPAWRSQYCHARS